jgi:hypothetical protein
VNLIDIPIHHFVPPDCGDYPYCVKVQRPLGREDGIQIDDAEKAWLAQNEVRCSDWFRYRDTYNFKDKKVATLFKMFFG